MEQLVCPSPAFSAEKRKVPMAAIWAGVAPTTAAAASPPCRPPIGKMKRKNTIDAAARAAVTSMTAAVILPIPGHSGQFCVCIHQTMPRTNQAYWPRATVLLDRQAGDAVNDLTVASMSPPVISTWRMQRNSTRRVGSWLNCRVACTSSHHRRGLSHSAQHDQYSMRKRLHAQPTRMLFMALSRDTHWMTHDAVGASRLTTSTR
mmetsp:Transcript_114195/g.323401  ORF Transcript_114195/g.323401 Transcript_114195/m.323401 type:complete len:204 (+) Transcript_114195:336-947(+)